MLVQHDQFFHFTIPYHLNRERDSNVSYYYFLNYYYY